MMTGFLYFIADETSPPGMEELAEAGLQYAFEVPPAATPKMSGSGPGGQSGMLLAAQGVELEYRPDKQTWRRLPIADCRLSIANGESSKSVWVGMWNDKRPGPEELARSSQLRGHEVRLADGQMWHVPAARRVVSGTGGPIAACALPHGRDVDDSGRWTQRRLLPAYEDLWQAATRFWDCFVGAAQSTADTAVAPTLEDELLYAWATRALATNYRVSAVELAMLGVLDDRNVIEVLKALIDWPTVAAWTEKKTDTT